jgi:cytochrome c553
MTAISSPGYYRKACVLTGSLLLLSQTGHTGMIDKQGMQAWEICAMCHNANGISQMPKFPKLAGQKADYLERQINAFRDGIRQNDGGQMQAIVGEVMQEEVSGIAVYFSSLPADTEVSISADKLDSLQQQKLSLGHALFTQGRAGTAERDEIAACKDCHASKRSSAPWIDGQHSQYLKKQIDDFYTGERVAECALSQQVQNASVTSPSGRPIGLTEAEIEALVFYLTHLRLERK